MNIEVTVPGLLADSVGGKRKFSIDAKTIGQAIETLRREHPLLKVHIYDDADQIRQHVLVYYNDESIKWIDDLKRPVKSGDRIAIIQAVSGG